MFLANLRPMTTLAQLALRPVPVVHPQTALDEVLLLVEEEPLHLVVLVGDEMYMGVFDKKALTSSLLPAGTDPALVQVGPYVHPTRPLRPTMTVQEALALLDYQGVDALPVVAGRVFKGVLTRSDLEATL